MLTLALTFRKWLILHIFFLTSIISISLLFGNIVDYCYLFIFRNTKLQNYLPESGSKFWEFIFSPSLQDRLFRIGDGLKITARFWKINYSNSGTRGCGAGPSRVTLNLSVHKAYKKNQSSCISQHFSLWFLSEGHFFYFLPKQSLWEPGTFYFWRLQVGCSSGKWWHWSLNGSWWFHT